MSGLSPQGVMTCGPQRTHMEPQVWFLFFWVEFHSPLSSPHSPPEPGPQLTLVSTCWALGLQGLALTSPLPCSLQEQLLEQPAELRSPAFPVKGT